MGKRNFNNDENGNKKTNKRVKKQKRVKNQIFNNKQDDFDGVEMNYLMKQALPIDNIEDEVILNYDEIKTNTKLNSNLDANPKTVTINQFQNPSSYLLYVRAEAEACPSFTSVKDENFYNEEKIKKNVNLNLNLLPIEVLPNKEIENPNEINVNIDMSIQNLTQDMDFVLMEFKQEHDRIEELLLKNESQNSNIQIGSGISFNVNFELPVDLYDEKPKSETKTQTQTQTQTPAVAVTLPTTQANWREYIINKNNPPIDDSIVSISQIDSIRLLKYASRWLSSYPEGPNFNLILWINALLSRISAPMQPNDISVLRMLCRELTFKYINRKIPPKIDLKKNNENDNNQNEVQKETNPKNIERNPTLAAQKIVYIVAKYFGQHDLLDGHF